MTTIENGLRSQTASEGMILKNGDSWSKQVYLGDGAQEWEEVPESMQPQPEVIDIEAEIIK